MGKIQKTIESNVICKRCPFWSEERQTCCRAPLVAEALDTLLGWNYSRCELFEDDKPKGIWQRIKKIWERHKKKKILERYKRKEQEIRDLFKRP